MLIGELSSKSGVSRDTIRYYEKLGLIRSTARYDNNYKIYADNTIHVIHFIRVCKGLGFTLKEIHTQLDEVFENNLNFQMIENIIEQKIEDIQRRIEELRGVSKTLKSVLNNCPKTGSIKDALFECHE